MKTQKIELTSIEIDTIKDALYDRIDYYEDKLKNYDGFGAGVKALYEMMVKESRNLVDKLANI